MLCPQQVTFMQAMIPLLCIGLTATLMRFSYEARLARITSQASRRHQGSHREMAEFLLAHEQVLTQNNAEPCTEREIALTV